MICPKCKTQNPDNAEYCHNCGYQLYTLKPVDVKICPNCEKINPLDQDECLNCHNSLSNTSVQKSWEKETSIDITRHLSPTIKFILALIIGIFCLIIMIGTWHSHNYISTSIRPLTITRHYRKAHPTTKKFYIAMVIQNSVQRDHQTSVFRGARYQNYNELNHVSIQKVGTKYRTNPASRFQMKMSPTVARKINLATIPKNLNTTHSIKIQYTWQSRHWYNVTTDRKHQTLIVHGPNFTDYISIDEAES